MATVTDEVGPWLQLLSQEAVAQAVGCVRSHAYVTQTGALQARCTGWQLGQFDWTDRVPDWMTPLTVVYPTHWRFMFCTPAA